MPVKLFCVVTSGLPTERHSCSSLTVPSTQDAFEFFSVWAVNLQRFLASYPGPRWQLQGTVSGLHSSAPAFLQMQKCGSCPGWLAHSCLYFFPRPYYIKVSTPAITFVLLLISIPSSQILLFLFTSNWSDSQIMKQHFEVAKKRCTRGHVYEKIKNRKLKRWVLGIRREILYLSAWNF